MKRSTLWLLALVPAASTLGVAAPRGLVAVPGCAPTLEAVAAEDTEYDKLAAEYKEAKEAYTAAAAEARKKKEKPPPKIEPEFFPRFEAFASKGHLGANLWCVRSLGRANLSNAQLKGKALGYCNTLVAGLLADEMAEKPVVSLSELVQRDFGGLVAQKFLTVEEAQGLCATIRDKAKNDESKAAAHLQSELLPFNSIEDASEREAKELEVHRVIAAKYPKTTAGAASRGQVNRIDNLVEGKVAPDFTTEDVEGVAFKLSDYKGKVVLLDFWGFW